MNETVPTPNRQRLPADRKYIVTARHSTFQSRGMIALRCSAGWWGSRDCFIVVLLSNKNNTGDIKYSVTCILNSLTEWPLPAGGSPSYRPWRPHLAGTRNTYPGFNCRHAPMTLAVDFDTRHRYAACSLPTDYLFKYVMYTYSILYYISDTMICTLS